MLRKLCGEYTGSYVRIDSQREKWVCESDGIADGHPTFPGNFRGLVGKLLTDEPCCVGSIEILDEDVLVHEALHFGVARDDPVKALFGLVGTIGRQVARVNDVVAQRKADTNDPAEFEVELLCKFVTGGELVAGVLRALRSRRWLIIDIRFGIELPSQAGSRITQAHLL